MKTIYKYSLLKNRTETLVSIMMPENAEIIHVAEQGNDICMWSVVNTAAMQNIRRFEIVGTGHEIIHGGNKHVGTAMCDGGQYVFHVFEIMREKAGDR